jgi:Spy/CpxP family protein refolding chaperone
MNSTRRRRFIVTPMWIAFVTVAGCGGESATGATAQAVPPSPPAYAPPPAAPAPAGPAMPIATESATAPPPPAIPPGPELAEGQEHREHHGGLLPLILLSLKDVDLTADQQASVQPIREDLLAKMEPARAAEKDFANTLADGVAAGAVDRSKADASIGKLVTEVQGLQDASLAAIAKLHDVLNPFQRAKLADELQAHWEKWKEAQGRDEQDDHQHRAGPLGALVAQLGLTQDEAKKIKANFHDRMKANPQEHAHKEVQDHLQAFTAAFKSDTFDPKKLTGAKAANGHMARWGATRRARFYEAAAPVLTPDQRTKLAQMIRDHSGRTES